MIIKTRRVRHSSRFSSRLRTGSRQRQEIAASTFSTAVIQFVLSVSLIVAAVRAFQAVDAHSDGVSMALKLALPVALSAAALFALRMAFRNFQSGRAIWAENRSLRERPPRERESRRSS